MSTITRKGERISDEVRVSLTTPLVSDVMDRLGIRDRCLGWDLVPLDPASKLVGHAFIVEVIPTDSPPVVPYQGLLSSLEAVGDGDVYVVPTGRSTRAAVWGELVSAAARHRGAVGALTDGLVRDTPRVRAMSFPVFARGSVPYDTNGRLETVRPVESAEIDGVTINRGDLIVGDADGIVVVPQDIILEVIQLAADKAAAESRFRDAVAAGMPPSEAFARFGVL